MILLGVNIDHIATLREVRKSSYPDLLEAAELCIKGGADQITVHLREDRRHIQDGDVIQLIRRQRLPVNLEMAFTKELADFAAKWKPFSVTLVPERRQEMTTESGLDLWAVRKKINLLSSLRGRMKVHAFIDPDPKQVELAAAFQFDGVEFHTGSFAHAFEKNRKGGAVKSEMRRLKEASEEASALGLEVKAGHGLTLQNVPQLLKVKELSELNIGHSIVCRAVMVGLRQAVSEMKALLKA